MHCSVHPHLFSEGEAVLQETRASSDWNRAAPEQPRRHIADPRRRPLHSAVSSKYLFRAAWDPVVVVERVESLGAWLMAVTEKLQFASLEPPAS